MYAPENTLTAFNLAIQQQANAIEFDVKLSADQQVVVIHDPTVSRTTDGHGYVSRLSLHDLKQLDAGSWFAPEFHGEKIPTLEDVFDQIGTHIPMNIELTNYTSPADSLVDKVVELVRRKGMENQVYFSSFLSRNLTIVQRLLPGCGTGYLTYAGFAGCVQRVIHKYPQKITSRIPAYQSVTRKMVKYEHQQGKSVLVYTVNNPDEMKKLFDMGIDGLITDDPLTGRKVASQYRN